MKVDTRVNVLDEIVSDQLRTDLPVLASGDTVRVSAKVVEGTRERIQVFEGTVMRLRGGGITRSITVRRIASGVGVERTFKINSPRIEKIEVMRHGQVRRAQLYFLRDRVGKAATLRERRPKASAATAKGAKGTKTTKAAKSAKAAGASKSRSKKPLPPGLEWRRDRRGDGHPAWPVASPPPPRTLVALPTPPAAARPAPRRGSSYVAPGARVVGPSRRRGTGRGSIPTSPRSRISGTGDIGSWPASTRSAGVAWPDPSSSARSSCPATGCRSVSAIPRSSRRRIGSASPTRSSVARWPGRSAAVEPAVIDRINILQATLLAAEVAASRLTLRPDALLLDGALHLAGQSIHQRVVIDGDRLCASVAAASVVAKVARDRLMVEFDAAIPATTWRGTRATRHPSIEPACARSAPRRSIG